MITSKDVKYEWSEMMRVITGKDALAPAIFKAVGKFLLVIAKLQLDNRSNTRRIMEKLGVEIKTPQPPKLEKGTPTEEKKQ